MLRALGCSPAVLAGLCLGVGGPLAGAVSRKPPSIVIPSARQASPQRPVTLEDILSVRQIMEPALSPDGTRVAYLVEQAFLGCNCTRTAIYVEPVSGRGGPRKIDEESKISNMRWTTDGRHISFLSARSGSVQLWWVDPAGGKPEQIFTHRPNPNGAFFSNALLGPVRPIGVADYDWSPDGRRLAFTAVRPTDEAARRRAVETGLRYDDSRMTVMDLTTARWLSAERTCQLWIYDVPSRRERLVWQAPPGTWADIQNLTWSPDGERLALSFPYGVDVLNQTAAVIDITTGRSQNLFDAHGVIRALAWGARGRSIAILSLLGESNDSRLDIVTMASPGREAKEIADQLDPGVDPSLLWIGDHLYFESSGVGPRRENGGLYELSRSGGQPIRITGLSVKVADCGRPAGMSVACVWQSPTRAPHVAVVNLQTGAVRLLNGVNPELGSVELGPVKQLHWANELGDETNGYLVLPPGNQSKVGHRPLVVMAYGFDGDFVTQANRWLSSYPAQAFARDGFAVLLINHPKWEYWSGKDFSRGARAWGYSPLSSLKVVIGRLSRQGVIDPDRVGFMGHSWAGFWAQFAASHSDLLRAVELLNGGTETEPGSYWESGHAAVRVVQNRFMGGGPYPPTLRNYLGFSAALTADRVRVPVLIESDAAEAPLQLEYFAALKAHHVPVDFVIYPDDGHNFTMPRHRMASMQRNLDWFEFWLLGKTRQDAGATAQYAAWNRMRRELAANARRK